jgi:chromosome segregation ATPase
MIRRTIFSVAGLALLSVFFFGRDAVSYVHTSAGMVKDSVKSAVPLTFELDRARKMVKELVPDIRRNMHVIAQEEVEVDRLAAQIVASEAKLDKDRGELVKLKNDASTQLASYQYGGRSYTISQVKADLANRFERFKTNDATLASLKDIQVARKKSLDAARQKLEGMLATKRQLEVEVENLDARLKMIEVAQTTSNYNFDDSQLGRAKELVSDLRTRLNVAERMLTVEGDLHDEIPVSAPASENIIEQVTEYLAPAGTGQVAEK